MAFADIPICFCMSTSLQAATHTFLLASVTHQREGGSQAAALAASSSDSPAVSILCFYRFWTSFDCALSNVTRSSATLDLLIFTLHSLQTCSAEALVFLILAGIARNHFDSPVKPGIHWFSSFNASRRFLSTSLFQSLAKYATVGGAH